MKTREEHLERCKRHARAYLRRYDLKNAVTSMLSNLQQHPETAFNDITTFQNMGFMYAEAGDYYGVKRFIEGFR